MNNQILTGIIIIAVGAILMAILGAIGTGYIQKGRTELAEEGTKKVTDNQDTIKGKLNSIETVQSSDSETLDSIRADQKTIKSQLEALSSGIMTKEEKERLLTDFGTILSSELDKKDFEINTNQNPQYTETTDDHKQQRIDVTISSAKYFFDRENGLTNKKYENHFVGAIGFDFQDFTVRNSKYDSKIRNKIIGAIGKLLSDAIDGTWRYRSLGDTYILFVPILSEDELIETAKRIHIVLNSYDWEQFDAELFLNTITTYTSIKSADEIEEKIRCILKSLISQKEEGTVFHKAIDKSNGNEELYTLISYKKLKR